MFDFHWKPADFGVYPRIFGFPTYSLFMILAIVSGALYYIYRNRKSEKQNHGAFEIAASALIFGVIGSKIPVLIESPTLDQFLYAKSIVGGLIGGMIGVILVKKVLKIKSKLGNLIAPAVALGLAVGRLGCYFNGCCYGVETHAHWGVDFGDGLLRYPTQLFEVGFHLIAFVLLHHFSYRVKTPGILFKLYLIAYFVFRFLIEFIRVNPILFFYLTVYQLLSCLAALYLTILLFYQFKKQSVDVSSQNQ